ncbi:hypothetical protein EGR_10283 [Echinococcus granulosus]|uniref:Uncharacterized protein n=1 Tax=Echinococcus granulosus TaxID=6210 RepID=W6U174_ECHGR|nr:hypothetical protein EGR_10283 [Echinococcus granulosus]EUB54865.1 hypothetical protein EGR_10283 [Echinococcus granulosus]
MEALFTQARSGGTSHSLNVANPEDDGGVIATPDMTGLQVTSDYLEGLKCCLIQLVKRMSGAIVESHNRPIGHLAISADLKALLLQQGKAVASYRLGTVIFSRLDASITYLVVALGTDWANSTLGETFNKANKTLVSNPVAMLRGLDQPLFTSFSCSLGQMSDRTLGTSLLSPRSVYLTLKGRQEQRRKRNECVDEWVGGESDTPVFSHLIAYLSTVLSLTLNFLPSCLFCACFTYPTFLYYTNKAAWAKCGCISVYNATTSFTHLHHMVTCELVATERSDNRSAIVRSIAWHDGGGETKAAPPPPPPSCQQCDQPGNQPSQQKNHDNLQIT